MGITTVEAVFLAIDPALHKSGAVLLAPDYGNGMLGEDAHAFQGHYVLHEFGKVISQSERERFVSSLLELSDELSEAQGKLIPPVIVAEEWDGPRDRRIRLGDGTYGWARDPKWTYTTIMGIGEGWGRWSAEIEAANEYRESEKLGPPLLLHRVLPNIWRDTVFGVNRAKDTDTLKAAAVRLFEGVFGFAVSDDIAEAGCIGLHALRDAGVCEAIPAWIKAAEAYDESQRQLAKAKKSAKKRR